MKFCARNQAALPMGRARGWAACMLTFSILAPVQSPPYFQLARAVGKKETSKATIPTRAVPTSTGINGGPGWEAAGRPRTAQKHRQHGATKTNQAKARGKAFALTPVLSANASRESQKSRIRKLMRARRARLTAARTRVATSRSLPRLPACSKKQ